MRISFKETYSQAFQAIKQNKLRSLLASLGVVIGISFVILMGWVITGLDKVLDDTINLLGSDIIYVDKWNWSGGKNWKLVMQRKPITLEQATQLCEKVQLAELAVVNARKWGGVYVKYNNDVVEGISIFGTQSEYSFFPSASIETGRFFSKAEDNFGANVAVIGWGVNKALFPNGDAIGKEIKINGYKFTIIGVLKTQATIIMDFLDNQIMIPMKRFLAIFGKGNRSFTVNLKAGSIDNLDNVRSEARGIMRQIRNLHPSDEDDFALNETQAFKNDENIKNLRLWVWGIGLGMTVLSFIVGTIGIINIMFVSVTERTKEIGIRKAVGAKNRDILIQILFESSTLCFTGALIAFLICSGFVFVVATALPQFIPQISFLTPYIPFNLLIIASIVSVIVGIFAGLIPAIRASNLNPVDALRYEN